MKRIKKVAMSVVLIGTMLLSACGTIEKNVISDTDNKAQESTEKIAQTNDTASGEKTTIKFWHTVIPQPGEADKIQEFVDQYMIDNPNVDIQITQIAWADLRTTLTPALKSGEGPDVFNYTPGPGYIGVLADAGLIEPLDEYVTPMGWDKIIPDWHMEQQKVNGKVCAIAGAEQLIGVYYNKQMYQELGLEVPNTYAEFVENCRAIKEGMPEITPLIYDFKDQWPTFHYSTAFYTAIAGAEVLVNAENTKEGWDSAEFTKAHEAIVALKDEGLTTKEPNALANADSNIEFMSGKAAMKLTGTWMIKEFSTKMGDNVGFFSLPPVDGVEAALAGNMSDQLAVSTKAESKEETIKFVDAFLRNSKLWDGTFGIPVHAGLTEADFPNNTLTYDAYSAIQNATGVATVVDTVMEQEFNNVLKNEYQKLIVNKITPDELSKTLQEAAK